ncbi:hypothetical protein [Jiangella asiatica]|uniref:Uncharacterized protein n=1 Tax=Jiangella asiatica TaxID=2530372 RepID=A0A4R5CTU4_9ACTN|nr:hypothetical protein [Jiangella asiatica]TDE02840.1 hypothetical protein E1269_21350 [Jiangella asiatica]
MGGAIYWRDENGRVWQAGVDHPLPVTDPGAVQAADMSADPPLTWDAGTTTMGITTDAPGGVPTLDGSGKISVSELPPLQHDVGQAATEAAMLALAVQAPAMCIRTDFTPPHVFMLSGDPATDIGNWHDVGAFAAASADPSADVGLTATNGTAATYMRSDGAPALNQGITPVWTGKHEFQAGVQFNDVSSDATPTVGLSSGNPQLELSKSDAPTDSKRWNFIAADTSFTLRTLDDAGVGAGNVIEIARTSNTPTGATVYVPVHMSEQKIVNVGSPSDPKDAATKAYVDSAVAGVGGGHLTVATQTGATVTLAADSPTVQLIDTTGNVNDTAVTLPAAPPAGKVFTIKQVAGTLGVTIDGAGANIDGTPNVGIESPLGLRTVVFDGTNWQIIGTSGA